MGIIADRIERAARSGREFTADTIREQLPPATRAAIEGDRTTLGNAFQSAMKHEVIEKVGYTLSQSPARKSGVIRTWRGVPKPKAAKPAKQAPDADPWEQLPMFDTGDAA